MMTGLRSGLAVSLVLLATNGAGGAACKAREKDRPPQPASNISQKTSRHAGKEVLGSELKVIAEGQYGRVSQAFVAIAREKESYARLQVLIAELPEMSADAFRTHVVVAAFLGTRPTGGYGVQIARDPSGSLRISETTPPKDAMTTQALTAPFKVVTVAVDDNKSLTAEMGAPWRTGFQLYQVREGEFTSSGGIAGRTVKFPLEGTLRAARSGKLVTIVLDLKGERGATPRFLSTLTTAVLEPDGSFTVAPVEAGTLVDYPNGGLRVAGRFTDGDSALALRFEPLPSGVADGFDGAGQLKAVAAVGGRR